jgi:hypothetical protein
MNELNETTNNFIYKRLHREIVARKLGECTYCSPHRGENAYGRKPRKSWKFNSNSSTQFKGKTRDTVRAYEIYEEENKE